MVTTEEKLHIEFTENILFILVESLDDPPENTYIYILPAAMILPKDSCG